MKDRNKDRLQRAANSAVLLLLSRLSMATLAPLAIWTLATVVDLKSEVDKVNERIVAIVNLNAIQIANLKEQDTFIARRIDRHDSILDAIRRR